MQEKSSLPDLGNGCTIIYGCVVGSNAHGTAIEGSDIDRKWVYVQSPHDLFINGYKSHVAISDDETAYELTKFIELLIKASPSALEMLFVPREAVIIQHEAFDRLLSMRNDFITKKTLYAFMGMVTQQLEKAMEAITIKDYKSLYDYCHFVVDEGTALCSKYNTYNLKKHFTAGQICGMALSKIPNVKNVYNLHWDTRYNFRGFVDDSYLSESVRTQDVPEDANCVGMLYFDKEEWDKQRKIQTKPIPKCDDKDMMHCMRLSDMFMEIAEFGDFHVKRPDADFLTEIRNGKYSMKSMVRFLEDRMKEMKKLLIETKLPPEFEPITKMKMQNYQIRKAVSESKTQLHVV